MKSFKKSTKLVFMLFLSMLLLIGCSGKESSSDGNGSGEKKVIEMWTRESSKSNVQSAVDAFNAGDHDFTVKLTSQPNANFTDQLVSTLASGDGPDILSLDLVFAPYFASIGALTDITDFYDSMEYKDEFIDGMVNMGQYEGKQFAVPFSADVSAMFYNKKHFEEAGLDPNSPPTTWAELRETAKALTTEDHFGYIYAGADVGGQVFTFLPYVWGNGGDVLSKDGKQATINSPEAIEALQFYADLTLKDKVTPEGVANYSWSQAQDAFTTGKSSILLTGNFLPLILKDYPDIDWGVSLIPKNEGKEHSSFSGGELIGIPTSSKNPEEAKEFIEFVLSDQVQVEVFAKAGSVPVRESFFENQYFDADPRSKVFTEALKVGKAPYSTQYNEIFSQAVLSSLQSALNGDMTPEEAFKKAEEEINKVLSK